MLKVERGAEVEDDGGASVASYDDNAMEPVAAANGFVLESNVHSVKFVIFYLKTKSKNKKNELFCVFVVLCFSQSET